MPGFLSCSLAGNKYCLFCYLFEYRMINSRRWVSMWLVETRISLCFYILIVKGDEQLNCFLLVNTICSICLQISRVDRYPCRTGSLFAERVTTVDTLNTSCCGSSQSHHRIALSDFRPLPLALAAVSFIVHIICRSNHQTPVVCGRCHLYWVKMPCVAPTDGLHDDCYMVWPWKASSFICTLTIQPAPLVHHVPLVLCVPLVHNVPIVHNMPLVHHVPLVLCVPLVHCVPLVLCVPIVHPVSLIQPCISHYTCYLP